MKTNNNNNNLLTFKPIQKFIQGLGKKIEGYFGKDKAAIVGLEDDGVFYGRGLYQWLCQKKKNLTFTTMDDSGRGLEEEKIKGRKLLLVDNDIITGTAYRRTMNFFTKRAKQFGLKEIKFAVLCDRVGLADFALTEYPSASYLNIKDLDRIDLEILKVLSQDGRKTFVSVAKTIDLTPVATKKRMERLLNREILKIQAGLNTEKFYNSSASIGLEADFGTVNKLIKKFENCPLVYNLVKVSGHHNLIIDLIAPNQKRIIDLIEKQIRTEPKIRYLEVNIGELPVVPKSHFLPNFIDPSKKCPCQKPCYECEYFL